ncbi:hypothetical protein F5J12DRAFT_896793 [Pisolithus orientalis]|uniref:uncharacterized protein n=1 Tax=Pisolithus orientalis TaxID=936130 RepID=UPI0022245B6F|nr:uncharacterized protein F5J12DRAFT_896793 [Pisolithus orientalis]KAI5994272.1 hypothetical protein F5J12DRAFT_896793 [Pisolithus orientalis]
MVDFGGAAMDVSMPQVGNRHSTPISQRLTSTALDLMPWVMEDVCKAQQCEADNMLEYILSRVSNSPGDRIDLEKHPILDKCMNAVLPICNGRSQGKKLRVPASEIKATLTRYAKYKLEDDLYRPFVVASNIALAHLKELQIDGMRVNESEEVQMFFQRNDPRVIHQDHAEDKSTRKPDVIVCSFANDAKYFKKARSSSWDEHVSAIGQGMKPPPDEYSVSEYRASQPKFLNIGKDGNELQETEPRVASVAERVILSKPVDVRRSPRINPPGGSGMASRKRTAGAEPEPRSSKRPRADEPRAHVTIQTALYAAEMQSANIAGKQALNCIVIGDDIWIWYYDHQGLISVAGFNFVQDLPHFLVLLYALQRFNLEDWGRNTDFEPQLEGDRVKSYILEVDGCTLELYGKSDPHMVLAGRGTNVMDVTCEGPMSVNSKEKADELVAKIYWAEEARVPEEYILNRIEEAGKHDDTIRGHVPDLRFTKRFSVSTSIIRKALGLKNPDKGSRVLVLLVSKKLSPVYELPGDEMFDAWRQCVLCHYTLWSKGIHHRDVSHSNLMYYRDGSKVMGVLNDYDLSSLTDFDNLMGDEQTGTMPFMAIDLLEKEGLDGKVEHLYRHDMESFIYVFIWISLQYKNGISLEPGPLDSWTKVDARGCSEKKSHFLALREVPEDVDNYNLVMDLVIFLAQRLNAHNHRKATEKAARQWLADARSSDAVKAAAQNTLNTLGDLREEEDEEVYKAFLSQIPSVN